MPIFNTPDFNCLRAQQFGLLFNYKPIACQCILCVDLQLEWFSIHTLRKYTYKHTILPTERSLHASR